MKRQIFPGDSLPNDGDGTLAMVMLRVTAEERVLSSEAEYERYSRRVKWRVLPFIW